MSASCQNPGAGRLCQPAGYVRLADAAQRGRAARSRPAPSMGWWRYKRCWIAQTRAGTGCTSGMHGLPIPRGRPVPEKLKQLEKAA